jgi:hypothetical protein
MSAGGGGGHRMTAMRGRGHAARGGGFRRGHVGLGYGYGGGGYVGDGGYDGEFDSEYDGAWGDNSCTWVGPLRICP